jgi:chromosome segregation ATPase
MTNKNMTNKNFKDIVEYGYYSKVLQKPFDSIEELREAEATHFAQLKAKEDKVAAKKADALKVEVAFKELNQARRDYKDNLVKLTSMYQEDLRKLKSAFEADQARVKTALADAEAKYSKNLKEFTDKYPEGYHLTLKDGDFETTIEGRSTSSKNTPKSDNLINLIDLFFNF